MGTEDKNSLSGQNSGSGLLCRLLGWFAGAMLFVLAVYLFFFFCGGYAVKTVRLIVVLLLGFAVIYSILSMLRRHHLDRVSYYGYGLGCRYAIPIKRWVGLGILRCLFFLIYFLLCWGFFGVFVRLLGCW